MTGFRADPTDLTVLATSIERGEPFTALADAVHRVAIPGAPVESSLAIERFTARLALELRHLATATGSLGHATRSAAAGYQEVDDSIRSMSTS